MMDEERALLFPDTYPHRRRSTTLEGIVNTLEWLLIALILAFVFRAFVMEAFRIPTGSMAETLRGQHFHLRCLQCGYPMDLGPVDPGGWPTGNCPSCGIQLPEEPVVSVSNGDRILVLKCLYPFIEPNRWDVVVFKNPTNPQENYIKRLVALPGETIEIIDGDIFIDGRIARKPPAVQEELWMPVYENDYQPPQTLYHRKGSGGVGVGSSGWRQPFTNVEDSRWNLAAEGPTVFSLDTAGNDRIHVLRYDSTVGKDYRSMYGYNEAGLNYSMPICSDLMVRFTGFFHGSENLVGAELKKYQTTYRAIVRQDGHMEIGRWEDREYRMINDMEGPPIASDSAFHFQFANVDHELILSVGRTILRCDLGRTKNSVGKYDSDDLPMTQILGSGSLTLRHVGVYRDIHYTNDRLRRAGERDPFQLNTDEYFVCGDNSPNSLDARLWAIEGIGNNGHRYRAGVVPKDYMMGKAFFVYWSNAFRPAVNSNWPPMIPNLSEIGFIVGGNPGMK